MIHHNAALHLYSTDSIKAIEGSVPPKCLIVGKEPGCTTFYYSLDQLISNHVNQLLDTLMNNQHELHPTLQLQLAALIDNETLNIQL